MTHWLRPGEVAEPERWKCSNCGANGEGRSATGWNGTYECPVCHKRKVRTNRCRHSGTPLCAVYGFGRHSTVADAIRCESQK